MIPQLLSSSDHTLPLWPVAPGQAIPDAARAGDWPAACGFAAKPGEICLLPDGQGGLGGALLGLGDGRGAARERFALARAASSLPKGDWRLESVPADLDPEQFALGWLLEQYRFDRYRKMPAPAARLICPDGVDAARLHAIARGEYLTRDLINTPAGDMGPDQLEAAARDLAQSIGAAIAVTTGDDLKRGYPMIHAVGRAAEQAPRLIDIRLGDSGPKVVLVGKGVCFDTGGLDIKPAASMGLMKKDMGGAATVLGLLSMLATSGAAKGMQLRVLIPAVENSIAGNAFRPGDILQSRRGLTVEVNNTDAEGRLVLADALALAAEDQPELLVSFATLTGAARVALGPDIPPFFCDDDHLADAVSRASMAVADPLWRMPFWNPYDKLIEPGIADLDNAPGGGLAGAITAALFLRRFVEGAGRYLHLDIYGWQPVAAPGRPKGGVGQGARALMAALPRILA